MIKRFFDLFFSLLFLIVFFPIFITVSLLVYFKLGSPVFFIQKRPGMNNKVFKMYKFRTMLDAYDKTGQPLPDSARLTTFGKILRSTSLDEIPGLLNVVKGDMSLVGPRPLLIEYLELYTSDQARRHLVRPGITGWAQVNGRNAISWEDKFKLDVWYVDHQSLMLDVKILILTVKKVFLREGITASDEVTMSKFTGNQSD
jgi:lipopolysaccharide/colanic/teichoic acid biosynthesis glycosyltransferase